MSSTNSILVVSTSMYSEGLATTLGLPSQCRERTPSWAMTASILALSSSLLSSRYSWRICSLRRHTQKWFQEITFKKHETTAALKTGFIPDIKTCKVHSTLIFKQESVVVGNKVYAFSFLEEYGWVAL